MAVNIIIDSKFDDRGIKKAQADLQRLAGDAAKRVAQVGVAVAAAGAVAAGKLAVDAVNAASDFEESVNAVNVAFGEAAQGVLEIGDNAAQAMGLSRNEFNQAAVRFSAFAERVVGEGGDVAQFIGDVSQRASDFASVFNIEVSEALQVFQSGLAGEAEPLKRFGINLLQSEVNAFAFANGIAQVGTQLTETQKVQARYGLLLEQTAKTQGDFQNTSDSLANSQRILRAEIENLQVEIGSALLPVAKDLVNTFAANLIPRLEEFGAWIQSPEGAEAVRDFGRQIENVVNFLLDFAGFIADNLGAIIGLGVALGGATVAVNLYGTAVQIAAVKQAGLNATIALNPFGLMAVAIAGVTAALGLGIAALINYQDANDATKLSQEDLNDRIVETRKELEFYRAEQANSANTSKLYESTISDLEQELRELRIAQANANGSLGEFSQAAEDTKFDRLRAEFGLTSEAAGELEEAQIRLSVVTQATMIQQDELARAMRAGAMGQENAGQFVRSIGEITEELYAKNKALMLGAEFTGDWQETLEQFEAEQNSVTGSTLVATAANNALNESYVGLTAEIDKATEAQKRFKEATPGSPFEGGFFEAVRPDGTTGVFNIEGEEFFGLRIGGEPVGRQERPTETVNVESPVSAGITPDLVSMDMSGIGARTMAGTSQPGNVTNINVNVSANSPLDAQEAGKNVVTALGRYQTTNGNVNTTLTGVGN